MVQGEGLYQFARPSILWLKRSIILLCRAMHAQLLAVRNLVQLLDPAMHSFMEEKSCLNYFFCYRWLLIHFKREFAFDEVGALSRPLTQMPMLSA